MKIPVFEKMGVEDCCGCELCEKVCPYCAIEMKENKEGFLYPVLDESKCQKCGVCVNKCPVLFNLNANIYKNEFKRRYFAGYAIEEDIVNRSSSGGMWTLIVNEFLAKYPEGIFVASKWTSDFKKVVYDCGDASSDIDAFRRSKYAQSYKGDIYKRVKMLLDSSKEVLFTGTPCEVSALYSYLKKDYEGLFTVDLVCQGPESPKALRDYMTVLEKKYRSRISAVSLREIGGASWIPQWMKVSFENGKEFFRPFYDTELGESLHTMQRLSCYRCRFSGEGHVANITIGDFHGADSNEKYYNARGTSIIIVNNESGLEFFNKAVYDKAVIVEMDHDTITKTNPRIDGTWNESPKRAEYAKVFEKGNVFTAAWHVWGKKQNLLFRIHPSLRRFIERIL